MFKIFLFFWTMDIIFFLYLQAEAAATWFWMCRNAYLSRECKQVIISPMISHGEIDDFCLFHYLCYFVLFVCESVLLIFLTSILTSKVSLPHLVQGHSSWESRCYMGKHQGSREWKTVAQGSCGHANKISQVGPFKIL